MGLVVPCFLIVATGLDRVSLRRYRPGSTCKGTRTGCHDASAVALAELQGELADKLRPDAFRGDARWPLFCQCGEPFRDDDERQVFPEALYRDPYGDRLITLREAPPGAMYDATWMHRKGPDGRSLVVVCPDRHAWHVDERARNCSLPDDDVHRCWVRHGEAPKITVDKSGHTCSAGGGSIDTGTWHGFLRDGQLVQ